MSTPNGIANSSPGERVSSKNSNTAATPATEIAARVACQSATPETICPGVSGVAAIERYEYDHMKDSTTGHIASCDDTIIAVVASSAGAMNAKYERPSSSSSEFAPLSTSAPTPRPIPIR